MGGLVPERQMQGAWLLFASGVHHTDNYWLLVCSDKQQPHCATFSITLCDSRLHPFCSEAQRVRREGSRQTPTGSLLTLGFLLMAPEERGSEPVFKLGKVKNTSLFLSLTP